MWVDGETTGQRAFLRGISAGSWQNVIARWRDGAHTARSCFQNPFKTDAELAESLAVLEELFSHLRTSGRMKRKPKHAQELDVSLEAWEVFKNFSYAPHRYDSIATSLHKLFKRLVHCSCLWEAEANDIQEKHHKRGAELLQHFHGDDGFRRLATVALIADVILESRQFVRLQDVGEDDDAARHPEYVHSYLERLEVLATMGTLLCEGAGDQLCTQMFLKSTQEMKTFFWRNQHAAIGWPGSEEPALMALAQAQNYVKLVRAWVEAEYPLCTVRAQLRAFDMKGLWPLEERVQCVEKLATALSLASDLVGDSRLVGPCGAGARC